MRVLQTTDPRADLWLVPNLNPDGYRLGVRQNGRGVDLNRNFGSEWRVRGARWDPHWQNHRFPGTASFVVELPPGPLSNARMRRHARAVVALAERPEPVLWRRSLAIGVHTAGRLVRGVQLPAEGNLYFTWDPLLRRSPNRAWRRWGTDPLVRTVLRVLADYRRAHPAAPRVGVGDLSRPNGGPFGPKHVSHQNGLDVDVYYPRRDRLERAPDRARQIDGRLSQDLVDRFVRTGAIRVFVGPNTRLRGDPRVVQRLAYHDTHLHVRLPPAQRAAVRAILESVRPTK